MVSDHLAARDHLSHSCVVRKKGDCMAVNDESQPITSGNEASSPSAPGTGTTWSLLDDLKTPLSRRRLLSRGMIAGIGATALGPLILSACGASSSGAKKGLVNLTYYALQDNTGEQTAEVNLFNQQYAGKIHVDYQVLPTVATDQYQKFVTAFQSQSGSPDVVHIDVTWPAQFAIPGWLAPIDHYVNAQYLSQFFPSAGTVGKVNGKLYGIQRYMDIGMFYYRTDLVKKYGGTLPTTRDALTAMAQIMQGEAANGVTTGILFPGKKIEAIVDHWLENVWGAGGDIGSSGNLQVNGQTQIDALQFMHDLIYTSKLSPSGTNTLAPADLLALFQKGAAPFMRNWTFAYTPANDPKASKVAGNVGVAPMWSTAGNQGHGCTGGWVLGINAYSQNKDEAWTFIDFLLSQSTQKSMSENAGLISSRPDVVNDPTVQAKIPYFSQIGTILGSGFNRPPLQNYNSFTTPMQAAINGVLSNQMSAADALNGVQTQVAAIK